MAGRGSLKCPHCRLTFPPPGYARQAWKGRGASGSRFQATCPHCGHADSYIQDDATW